MGPDRFPEWTNSIRIKKASHLRDSLRCEPFWMSMYVGKSGHAEQLATSMAAVLRSQKQTTDLGWPVVRFYQMQRLDHLCLLK